MEFVYAERYNRGTIHEDIAYIGILEYKGSIGPYNLYRLLPGEKNIVVFNDQVDLLNFVSEHLGELVMVKLLKRNNLKFKYEAGVRYIIQPLQWAV